MTNTTSNEIWYFGSALPEVLDRENDNRSLDIKIFDLKSPFDEGLHGEKAPRLILLDAHGEFADVANFFDIFVRTLYDCLSTKGMEFDWSTSLLFVSPRFNSPTPPLDTESARPNSLFDPSTDIDTLRQNQFFIRMVASYGWGTFCKADRVSAFAKRKSLDGKKQGFSLSAIGDWKDDLGRVFEVLKSRIERGFWVSLPRNGASPLKNYRGPSEFLFPGVDSERLLRILATVHQYGRRQQEKFEETLVTSDVAWFRRSSIEWSDPTKLGAVIPSPTRISEGMNAREVLTMSGFVEPDPYVDSAGGKKWWRMVIRELTHWIELRADLFLFDLLADLSQMLSKGCAHWASRSRHEKRPLKVLAIKDFVRDEIEKERNDEYFIESFAAAFRPGDLELDCLDVDEAGTDNPKNQSWDTYQWWKERLKTGRTIRVNSKAPLSRTSPSPIESHLLDYDILLIEAEFETRFVGPSIIQWIDHAFDELFGSGKNGQPGKTTPLRPQVFVLSRNESAGHSFQCLWLGAQAFASKSRIFGIPALLTMANVGKNAVPFDTKRRRPNFFAIDGLLPHQRNRLQSRNPADLIRGDEWDRWWLSELPKADLHFHIGTSISLDAIKAMAVNTAGYAIGEPVGNGNGNDSKSSIQIVIENACKIVLLTGLERSGDKTRGEELHRRFWAVSRFLLLPKDKRGDVVSEVVPEFGALEQVVEWLTPRDRPIRTFDACSILVSALHVFECYGAAVAASDENQRPITFSDYSVKERFVNEIFRQWGGLTLLAQLISSDAQGNGHGGLVEDRCRLTEYLCERIAAHWSDHFTKRLVQDSAHSDKVSALSTKASRILASYSQAARDRAEKVFESIAGMFDLLLANKPKWIDDATNAFTGARGKYVYLDDRSLRDKFRDYSREEVRKLFEAKSGSGSLPVPLSLRGLVEIPHESDGTSGTPRSLKRYLIGCGLLGAEHLQLPENLILAGMDVSRQNVADNVVYSEVRCATTGYCQAGMNVYDATELLCLGFDLGAMLFGEWNSKRRMNCDISRVGGLTDDQQKLIQSHWGNVRQRWVRTNVLLGAKRHKPDEIGPVVELVQHYLERGTEIPFHNRSAGSSNRVEPGSWWKQCSVVGFDLSGNEAATIEDLQKRIEPLFAACASITIHAGESVDANSIWDAVHHLGAQRIGHGIRLRENAKLLEHCVRRGICMELCPISNSFTNNFCDMPVGAVIDSRASRSRDSYPLKDFLDGGLDVCLNTDNRSLHRDGTLTDEYLKAAKLSGGLSRWDVLRICKSAFKNAFLSKDELAAILRHVEYEIYKIASEHSGENEFPIVEHLNAE